MADIPVDSLHKTPLGTTTPPPDHNDTTEVAEQPIQNERQTQVMARKKSSPLLVMVLALVVVAAGVGSGYALSQLTHASGSTNSKAITPVEGQVIESGKVYGDVNDADFKDEAEGILVKGGIEGEGSHHLIREGGASQYVYLTSSVMDLDQFAGAKVHVRGETFSAQKAGWLMDVGQVKVLELNAAPAEAETTPTEE